MARGSGRFRQPLPWVVLVALVSLLGACGGPTAGAPLVQTVVVQQTVEVPKEVVVTPTPAPTPEGGKVVLRVGTGDSGEGLLPHLQIIEKFEKENPDIQVQLPGPWTTGFEYWVAAAGGRLVSQDGKTFTGYMNSPETIGAVQFYSDLYHKYKVAPPPADMNSFGGGNSEFDNGTAAMRIFGRWPQAGIKNNPNVKLGVVGVPAGKQRANVLFWGGFGISALSKNPEAAWRFLRFYVGERGALIYLQNRQLYTVTLGLQFFRSTYTTNWAYLMAASLVTMLPVLALFFAAQRLFIEGITLTGVKS